MSDVVEVTEVTNQVVINSSDIVVVTEQIINVVTAGAQGPQGVGLIAGGTAAQKLVKQSATNYDAAWADDIIPASLYLGSPSNITIPLDSSARIKYNIDGLYNLKTSAGSIDVIVAINGTPVTGLSVTASGVTQDALSSAASSVDIGDRVTLQMLNNSSAQGLEFTMKATKEI